MASEKFMWDLPKGPFCVEFLIGFQKDLESRSFCQKSTDDEINGQQVSDPNRLFITTLICRRNGLSCAFWRVLEGLV